MCIFELHLLAATLADSQPAGQMVWKMILKLTEQNWKYCMAWLKRFFKLKPHQLSVFCTPLAKTSLQDACRNSWRIQTSVDRPPPKTNMSLPTVATSCRYRPLGRTPDTSTVSHSNESRSSRWRSELYSQPVVPPNTYRELSMTFIVCP